MNLKEKQSRFMILLEPLLGNLNCFAFSLTENRETAKDLINETILIAWEKFDSLKNDKAFLSFLFTITSRVNVNNFRKLRVLSSDYNLDEIQLISDELSPEEKTDISILYEALDKLPDLQKEAVILFDIIGLSQKDISEIQKTTVVNIKIRLHRAKKKLAELLLEKNILDNTQKPNPTPTLPTGEGEIKSVFTPSPVGRVGVGLAIK